MLGRAWKFLSMAVGVLRWPMVLLALACGSSFVSGSLWLLAHGVSLHSVILLGVATQSLATFGMIGRLRYLPSLWMFSGFAAAVSWIIAFTLLLQLGQDMISPAAGMFIGLFVFPFLLLGTGLQWLAAIGFLVDRA